MKLQDFEKVKTILEKLKVLNEAVDTINEGDVDNYECVISQYEDGSSWNIDLTGACITDKVLKALHNVIEDEIDLLEKELIELGVKL